MTDAVNHPAHYQTESGIEAIDVIEAMVGLEGHAANAIKYVLRHKAKGRPAEDLAKAKWYVDRLLHAKEAMPRKLGVSRALVTKWAHAFVVGEHAHVALMALHEALISDSDVGYRTSLSRCTHALGTAIAEVRA